MNMMNSMAMYATINVAGANINIVLSLILSLIIGFIIALIVVSGWKAQLKSVHKQSGAADYKVKDSLRFSIKKDAFLYTRVEKREKPQNNNN